MDDQETPGHKCLFIVKLQMEVQELYFEPAENDFTEALKEILERFQDCTLALPNFVSDPFFHSFTRCVCVCVCACLYVCTSPLLHTCTHMYTSWYNIDHMYTWYNITH